MADIVTTGEALVAGRVPEAGVTNLLPLGVAGAELNVAMALSGAGRSAHFASRVGEDPFGALIQATLENSGVESTLEIDKEARTGFYLRVENVARRVPYYYRKGSAGSRLPSRACIRTALQGARFLHITGITAALHAENAAIMREVMDDARSLGCSVSFDVNYRATLWDRSAAASVLRELALSADLVFVGADEAEELWNVETAAELHELLPVRELVIKNGDRRQVHVAESGRGYEHFRVEDVTVIDSVGAGDAFAAGYLHAKLAGATTQAQVATAHAFAAEVMSSSTDALDREGVRRALVKITP